MDTYPSHIVAVIGGAVAGSEAAANLAGRGIKIVVFEQNTRPYGKIEDGLPKWHVKLREKEEKKIDEKLSDPNILFVPQTLLGRDINLTELIEEWGFTAVLLANGAWQDRPLLLDGIDNFVNNGLIYQNDLVGWFNHYHEPNYNGINFEIQDAAIVIGGGLASLDVVKIIMFETVIAALKKISIQTDILELEHDSISKVLERHNLTLDKIGLKGCTLFYRRKIEDMPLAAMPIDATPEKKEKVYVSRAKILKNFMDKYLFKVRTCAAPSGIIIENGKLSGVKFNETKIINDKVHTLNETEFEVRSPQIISSIGSIPQPIEGIDMTGELYDLNDQETGQLKQFENVFALGNVVTGKGNIRASSIHSKQVTSNLMDNILAWRDEDYEKILKYSSDRAKDRVDKIAEVLGEKKLLDKETIQSIINKTKQLQKRAGYSGTYSEWIAKNRLANFAEVINAERHSSKKA